MPFTKGRCTLSVSRSLLLCHPRCAGAATRRRGDLPEVVWRIQRLERRASARPQYNKHIINQTQGGPGPTARGDLRRPRGPRNEHTHPCIHSSISPSTHLPVHLSLPLSISAFIHSSVHPSRGHAESSHTPSTMQDASEGARTRGARCPVERPLVRRGTRGDTRGVVGAKSRTSHR